MDIELENEIQKRLHKYHKKMWASYGTIAIDILFLIYMVIFKLDLDICSWSFGIFGTFLIYVAVFAAYAAIAVLACLLEAFGKLEIEKILFEECDPFLYEACAMRIKQPFFKDRVNCNLAVARYYQGNTDAAYDTLMAINPEKLKREFALNYYLLLSMIYFQRDMGQQVPELEQACRRKLSKNKKGQALFAHLCACNNFRRAMANKDYDAAFGFMQDAATAPNRLFYKLHQIAYSYDAALLYRAAGEKASTGWNLDYIAQEGNKLFVVQKAEEMR